MVGVAAPTEEAAAEGGGEGHRGVSQVVIDEFTKHANAMRESSRARRDAVRLRSVVDDDHDAVAVDIRDTLGVPQPQDKWQGCTNLRTLRTLLSIVDDRGFERSPHQIAFHSAFERCVSRVVYKKDWGTSRPAIMRKNEWKRCSSEVLISTPRRFGKTFSKLSVSCWAAFCCTFLLYLFFAVPWAAFCCTVHCFSVHYGPKLPTRVPVCARVGSIAIFCACLALSFGTEVQVICLEPSQLQTHTAPLCSEVSKYTYFVCSCGQIVVFSMQPPVPLACAHASRRTLHRAPLGVLGSMRPCSPPSAWQKLQRTWAGFVLQFGWHGTLDHSIAQKLSWIWPPSHLAVCELPSSQQRSGRAGLCPPTQSSSCLLVFSAHPALPSFSSAWHSALPLIPDSAKPFCDFRTHRPCTLGWHTSSCVLRDTDRVFLGRALDTARQSYSCIHDDECHAEQSSEPQQHAGPIQRRCPDTAQCGSWQRHASESHCAVQHT